MLIGQGSNQIHPQPEHRMCTNYVAETIYSVGSYLTRPILREADAATRIFGPYRWPGRDLENVKNWERVVLVLRGVEFFTLAIPILPGIFGLICVTGVVGVPLQYAALLVFAPSELTWGVSLIGHCFKVVASYWSQPASLIENTEIDFKIINGDSITVKTHNLCAMPKFLSSCNNMCDPRTRVLELAGGEEDVLFFQEAFQACSVRILSDLLTKNYRHIVHTIAPNEWGLNSGLMIASKYKVLDVHFRPFNNCTGEDWLANKGFVRAAVDLGEGRTAVLYNVHGQSKPGKPFARIRQEQLQTMREAIKADNQGANHEAVILCGDFNLHNGESDEILGSEFVEQAPPAGSGTLYHPDGNGRVLENEQVDRIYSIGGVPGDAVVKHSRKNGKILNTDHLSLTATILTKGAHRERLGLRRRR